MMDRKKRIILISAACAVALAGAAGVSRLLWLKAAVPAVALPSSFADSGRPSVPVVKTAEPKDSAVFPAAGPEGGKTAYLTFDDGPSALTPELLDVLKEQHVRATFFIVGLQAQKYPDTLKRMTEDGDAIGVHSWTHQYPYIYKNTGNFLEDFDKLSDYIDRQTGVMPEICRFPGGTNNTVYRHYSRGRIMKQIVSLVHQKGFEYFDWNVSSGEASPVPPSEQKIEDNVLPQCQGKKTVVILFHDADIQEYVDVIPKIVAGLRSQGFGFDALSKNKLTREQMQAVQFLPQ